MREWKAPERLRGVWRATVRTSGSVCRRVHVCARQVDAEEAGIGRGGIADAGRCTNAAAKTLQSLSSCSHIHYHQQHHSHTGRRVHASPSLSHQQPGAFTLTRQQRGEQKDLVWLYLSPQSHVGFVIGINIVLYQLQWKRARACAEDATVATLPGSLDAGKWRNRVSIPELQGCITN